MKTNAPEKIYVYIPDDDIVGTASIQKGFPHQFVTDEYTRTDAFIEKAAEWLNNFYNEDTHSYLIDEDIEKFINYMKGENK